jgi:CsoR family transcriptional regulator, copper-sensing transcriptional repressor
MSQTPVVTDSPATPDPGRHHHHHSYGDDKARILARLKRIEGQVRGISRMLEDDKYCIDILTQVSAVIASTRSVGMLVLEDHIKGCVMDAGPDEREATLAELNQAIERFVRSVGN